ncbi:MAG: ATP synthase subunit I [Acidobacteriota bacterium]
METDQALARVRRIMGWMAGGIAIGVALWAGWLAALAFLLGAAGAYLNFSWLKQMVASLGPDAPPATKRVWVLFVIRYGLLAAGGYVIVKVFGMNGIAALAGLFVPVAAIFAEILYELVHGT